MGFINSHRKAFIAGLRGAGFIIGYILSPLSWWNDLFVNVPLSYLFALLVTSITNAVSFPLAFSIGYMLTNIAGIMLMKLSITLSRKNMVRDILLSVIYSVVAYIILSNIL